MENRFCTHLRRLVEGRLSKQGERSFIELHVFHFSRRVERLPANWFPGREKSGEAVRSLANGAYAHLANEPLRRHLTAFELAYFEHEGQELSWLYYWPRSACMQWLRRQSAQQLAPMERLRRNARNQLKTSFFKPVASWRGEPAWAPAHWPVSRRHGLPPVLDALNVDVRRLGPCEAILTLLEAAQAPLTLTQLVDVWARSLVLVPREHGSTELDAYDDGRKSVELAIEESELLRKVRHFWKERLTREERALLRCRGYGGEKRLRPFAQVAEMLGRFGAERWRQRERSLLEMAREVFQDDPSDEVAQLLALVIGESPRLQPS
ncbi:MAG: hypothetical protein AAF627_06705 [Myxococcota bacterium]